MNHEVRVIDEAPVEEAAQVRFLRAAPRRMRQILTAAAREERSTHGYQNRTGDLERSTQAGEVIEIGDTRTVVLEMGEEYASFVNTRGLSNIDEIAERAATEIEYMLDGGPT